MRLTSFTDYGLRVLIYVASQPEGRATIAEIAAAFAVSENHLTKVVHFLGKSGYLHTTRGRGGGLRLARPADRINVGEVVRRAEGVVVAAECFEPASNTCVIAGGCRLRGALTEAVKAFHAVLAQYTLQDMIANRASLIRVWNRPLPEKVA